MIKRHPIVFGMFLAFGGTWVYHHFLPGKGIGLPGSLMPGK